jgi:glyoxylase-like metal-dependent hydrolase (beta-lactamase superfamily II)
MRYFLSLLFFTVYLFGFDYHLKPYKLNDGINCFFGLPSNISEDNGGNMINSCYIETEEGYIVIDSGPTYSYAQSTYEIMKNKKNLPVKYVINTSSDEVHILGNGFFKEQNAILIGPKSYKRDLQDKKKLLISDKISKDALLNTRFISIDKYLENDLNITFGDLVVNIKKIKNDDEHLIVYIPSKKIVFAGDMIFNNRIVAFKNNRSILVWQEGIELLKSLEWDDIVSAHGYMTRRSALKNTESYLSLLKSEVKSSILSGESKENAIKNIKLSAFSEDRLYSLWHHKNVATVYDELKSKYKLSKSITLNSKPLSIKKSEKKSKKTFVSKKVKKVSLEVHYVPFSVAEKNAKSKKKIIFLKVRSTTCQYCDELDAVISSDNAVKDILNKYFEVVSVNNDYEPIPYNIRIEHTPTLIFFKPGSEEPLMNLTGIKALGEFLDVLKEAVDDGHKEGYLRP